MKLIITRIDQGIVTCELEEGTIIDIASRWFSNDIQIGDIIEFDAQKVQEKMNNLQSCPYNVNI